MSTTQGYTVRFHYEINNRKVSQWGEELQAHVAAAASDAATITAVLNANGYAAKGGSTLVIDSIGNAGPSQFST
jgi:hypothetical protein